MSNIEKIRQEIERLKKIFEESTYYLDNSQQALGYSFALDDFKEFIDSLPEEKPSEDMEEAAEKYSDKYCSDWAYRLEYEDAFIAGAKWMRKKDVEDMYLSDNRHFLKCYEQGKVDMKVEMMKDAVEGEIGYWNQRGLSIRLDKPLERLGYDMDTKVKIVIEKEDDGLHQAEEG